MSSEIEPFEAMRAGERVVPPHPGPLPWGEGELSCRCRRFFNVAAAGDGRTPQGEEG